MTTPIRDAGDPEMSGSSASPSVQDEIPPCRGCEAPLRRRESGPDTSTRRHWARGLCRPCWQQARRNGTLADHPRALRTREEMLEDYVLLWNAGCTPREAAERMGMSFVALDRALCRARAAGMGVAR